MEGVDVKMKIGRKIYYDIVTGVPILDTGQYDNAIRDTTVEEDIETYLVLSERSPNSYDVLKLEFDQYQSDFQESNGFWVNPETKKLEFSYPDPDNTPSTPGFQQPLTDQITDLKQAIADITMTLAAVMAG